MVSQHLPDPSTAPDLFESLLTRRAVAWIIDTAVIAALVLAALLFGVVAGALTLGIGLVAIPFIVPVAVLAYYSLTLGSRARATIGMRMMDIVLTPTRGRPLDGWRIIVHPVLFWVSFWISWPVSLLIAFFTPRRQMLHDVICGTLMVRRSPMERHWQVVGAGA